MPELPEVETIRKGLKRFLVGHKIEDVEIRLKKMFSGNPKDVIGAKIIDVRRFGKGLVIDLDNKFSIAAHIKLTGQFIYKGPNVKSAPSTEKVGSLPGNKTHIIFKLDKNSVLYYNDLRQFGWIKIIKTEDLKTLPFFKQLGPEPFKDLTLDIFKKIVKSSKIAIKVLIMDQKRMSGVGNIYANDALYLAKIDPRKSASSLSEGEIEKLFAAIETVLKRGIEYGGSSELNYVNALGQEGSYQDHTLVYGKVGQNCPDCKGKISKIRLGGRGTYYCPACQK